MKLKALFIALIGASMINLTACGDDDEPKTKSEKTETSSGSQEPSNPMAGKTIRCREKQEDSYLKISTDFTIQFTNNTRFTETNVQTAHEYTSKDGWHQVVDYNETVSGTYTYSSNEITLNYDDGRTNVLTREGDGWKKGYYFYK